MHERKPSRCVDGSDHSPVRWNLLNAHALVHPQFCDIDFDLPGKHHYQVAFHLDGSWGYSLVPLTVINGKRGPNANGVICFGGTHGNEYEGQIGLKRLGTILTPNR